MDNGLTNTIILGLALDPSTTTTVYAGTDYGMFKSINGGNSWSGLNTQRTYALAVDPTNSATLYAATDFGVYRSTNGGVDWNPPSAPGSSLAAKAVVLNPATPTTLYAGGNGGVFNGSVFSAGLLKSVDGGANWVTANSGLGTSYISSIVIDPLTPDTLYAAPAGNCACVYKSTNGGAAWTMITSGLDAASTGTQFGAFVYVLTMDPANPSTLYAGTYSGVFKSTNSGASWSRMNTGLSHTNVRSLALERAATTTLYAGTSGGSVYAYTFDTTPAAFTVIDQSNVALGTTVTSNIITVTGIEAATPISSTGGTYSINGGAYTSGAGIVNNGDTVTVSLTSASNHSTGTSAVINIGGISDTFTVTTLDDTVPNAFTFTDQTNAALSTLATSNTITVTGISVPVAISIVGGTYSVNGGSYTSNAGTVNNGETVNVRVTSSASYVTAVNATLTIGGVSDTFSVTTKDSTQPDPFAFTDQTGAALSTTVTSNTITVTGIGSPAAISISGGTYSINGGAFTSTAGTASNGNTVAVRVTSAATPSTTVNATLTIGGVSDTFSVTTLADTVPDAFTFTDQSNVAPDAEITSNTITVAGITAPVAISVLGGTYSVNGGAFTSTAGTMSSGDRVAVRVTSSGSYSATVGAILTVGGVSDTFSVTTRDANQPDAFAFTDVTGAALNSEVTSNTITVSGLEASAAVSISGGMYSINSGAYTRSVGTVNNGDTVTVRITSSINYATRVNADLAIGSFIDRFTVTTLIAPATTVTPPVTTTTTKKKGGGSIDPLLLVLTLIAGSASVRRRCTRRGLICLSGLTG